MTGTGKGVVCLGDPVIDILAHVKHETFERLNLKPGGCVAVSSEEQQIILSGLEEAQPLTRYMGP